MKLLLIIADIDEFVPFKKCVERRITEEFIFRGMPAFKFSHKGIEVTALCFGIGKVNAATGAALALSELKFDGVINTGWSGAVSGVAKGDVIVATSFVECDFDMTAIGKLPAQKPGQDIYVYNACGFIYDAVVKANEKAADSHAKFKFGALGTGDIFLSDKKLAQYYKETFGIKAFDMESAAVASVCRVMNMPLLCARKISDSANDAAPSDYRESLFSDENANVFYDIVFKVLGALCEP